MCLTLIALEGDTHQAPFDPTIYLINFPLFLTKPLCSFVNG
jgi:hypothetical protein